MPKTLPLSVGSDSVVVMKLVIFTLVSSLLVACGGGEAEPIAFEILPNEIARSSCEKIFECCDSEDLEELFDNQLPTNVAECTTELSSVSSSLLRFQPSIDVGKIIYHADRAGDCVAEMDSANCATFAM